MSTPPRGRLLDKSPAEVEATTFAREYALEPATPDAREAPLRGYLRHAYRSRSFPGLVELELLASSRGSVEVAGLWIERRWLNDRAQLPAAVTLYASFLAEALGDLDARDLTPLGNFLAVSYDLQRTFEPVLGAFPFVPRDGVGAASEVFLGRRMDGAQRFRAGAASLVLRNDASGRLFVGVATASAVFELGDMLLHAAPRFRTGERSGVLGWKTPDLEATPFGRRFGLELDRAAPPKGRIARRYYGLARIPRTARVEVMIEPTRGLAGVLLRIDQEWMEQSDKSFFAALELLAAFVAEGLGDVPDARARVEVGELFSVRPDDGDLLGTLQGSLPFVTPGPLGDGLAVFLGEADAAVGRFDDGRVTLLLQEASDAWLDCVFYVTELAEAMELPGATGPDDAS